jgi:hypothetical protein
MNTTGKTPIDILVESFTEEHINIKKELSDWKKRIISEPDLIGLKKFIDYYYSRISVHAGLEEQELPVKAAASDSVIDLEAFRFAHSNLDLHIEGLKETLDNPKAATAEMIIREVTEMCDLIDNHFHEEEHHLFPRDMEEIYESSGGAE